MVKVRGWDDSRVDGPSTCHGSGSNIDGGVEAHVASGPDDSSPD